MTNKMAEKFPIVSAFKTLCMYFLFSGKKILENTDFNHLTTFQV